MEENLSKKEALARKRRLAYILFVDNHLEQKVIAKITGISEKSIGAWKEEDNWEQDRQQATIGPEKQLRRLMRHYDTILTEIENRPAPNNVPTSTEADTVNKLASAVNKLRTEVLFGHKTEVGKQFIAYIQSAHGQAKAIEMVELWHEYLMAQ